MERYRKEFMGFDPMYTDRQLWALGMIVAQWATFEQISDDHFCKVLRPSDREHYKKIRRYSERREFFKTFVRAHVAQPFADQYLDWIARSASLQHDRDTYVHGLAGGAVEPGTDHRHVAVIRNVSRVKGAGPPVRNDFKRMKAVAIRISEISKAVMFFEYELAKSFNVSDFREIADAILKR